MLAFLAVSTQWRAIARGMEGTVYWMGLDYTAARVSLEELEIRRSPTLWAGLRVMEREARDALNGVRG